MIARIGKKLAYRDFAAYTTCGLMSAVLVLLVAKGLPIWLLIALEFSITTVGLLVVLWVYEHLG
ncbi:MAG: hypothetical protein ABSE71_04065 [Candidatus Micrarchaeaceae archaeon]